MRILIVEDEPDLLRSLAQALREEGYAVDTANNGEDGLFNAEGTDYDAIVLDVMLPKMDGWEILKRLRKTKKTPVLMLTARDQSRDRVRGLDTGRMITSSSRSICRNCSPGSARSSAAVRTKPRTSLKSGM